MSKNIKKFFGFGKNFVRKSEGRETIRKRENRGKQTKINENEK